MGRRIKVTVNTGFAGAVHQDEMELPDDWDEWSEKDQWDFLTEVEQTAVSNFIEVYAEVVED